MAKYCINCGAPIEAGAKYCIHCGAFFGEDVVESDKMEATEEIVVDEVENTAEETHVHNDTSQNYRRYENIKQCSKCGGMINADAVVCVHCGCDVEGTKRQSDNDSDHKGWGILGFFLPIVGFILWLCWKKDKPKRAKTVAIGTLIGACFSVISSITSLL